MKYYIGKNTGKGFITHEDNEIGQITEYPGDIWVTENWRWGRLRGLQEIDKQEAQEIVDLAIYHLKDDQGEPLIINLP